MPTQSSGTDLLARLGDVIRRRNLVTLIPLLDACRALDRSSAPLDVAVFGQFKSGKSSLLNAIVGEPLLPVGVVPVTAVITRVTGGADTASVTRRDGTTFQIGKPQVAEYVSETGNPRNREQVAVVDISTPALNDLPGLRLVDTPGLGSVHLHNTQATREWLPSVAAAMVVVSAERPLSAEDIALIRELIGLAPHVVVVLSKIDLVSPEQRDELESFVAEQIRAAVGRALPIIRCSIREDAALHVKRLKGEVLTPIGANARAEKQSALELKLNTLTEACRAYLHAALASAERTDQERAALKAAVFDESVSIALANDELALAQQRLAALARPAFQSALLARRGELAGRIAGELDATMRTWTGHLARQVEQYEEWMRQRMTVEVESASTLVLPIADDLLRQAESRFQRIAEAMRGRLARNLTQASGVVLPSLTWQPTHPRVAAAPIAIGRIFDTSWDLLWWLFPMAVFGGLFRRHCVREVWWETEKNLIRLAGAWSDATCTAIQDLREQVVAWLQDELNTLADVLKQSSSQSDAIRADLASLIDPSFDVTPTILAVGA
jgi:GTP-binding protein EngB required for normal cell division